MKFRVWPNESFHLRNIDFEKKVTPSGSSLECRYLGGRQSNISESKSFLESILLIRKHYDVPSPSICKLFIDQSDLTIHTSDDASHALRTKLIKHIPLEGNIILREVDFDKNFQPIFVVFWLTVTRMRKFGFCKVWTLQNESVNWHRENV